MDYDAMEASAAVFRPKLLICGASAYPRDWDYARMRSIADKNGSMLMMDMAHTSGLVAAEEQNQPFEFCDIVTTTTHKSLRGPRGAMIFFRKGLKLDAAGAPQVFFRGPKKGEPTGENYDYEERVNFAVFPSCQGGPHNNAIAALGIALLDAKTPEFKQYAVQVKKNAHTMAEALKKLGYTLVSDGTDNHLVLWDLKPQGITGSKASTLFDYCTC